MMSPSDEMGEELEKAFIATGFSNAAKTNSISDK